MPSDSIVSELSYYREWGGAQHTPKQPSPTFWAHGPLVGDRCSKGPWMFLFLSFFLNWIYWAECFWQGCSAGYHLLTHILHPLGLRWTPADQAGWSSTTAFYNSMPEHRLTPLPWSDPASGPHLCSRLSNDGILSQRLCDSAFCIFTTRAITATFNLALPCTSSHFFLQKNPIPSYLKIISYQVSSS